MWQNILKYAYLIVALCGALCGAIPTIIALGKAIKSKRNAKSEADKEKAQNEIREALDNLIVAAEDKYKDIEAVLKQSGKSAGTNKKSDVLAWLWQFAYERGYYFDKDYWDKKIDEVVALTKKVN